MSERPNYAEECQVDPDCRNPRVASEPGCAVHMIATLRQSLQRAEDEVRVQTARAESWRSFYEELMERSTAMRAERDEAIRTTDMGEAYQNERERRAAAEAERDEALALVRAKQSWIDGMKIDYDALNDEANAWRQRAEEAEEVVAGLRQSLAETAEESNRCKV